VTACVCLHVNWPCVYICMYIYIYTYTCGVQYRRDGFVTTCVCLHVNWVWVYINIYIYIHTHTYVMSNVGGTTW